MLMRDIPSTTTEAARAGVSIAPAGPFIVRRHAPGKPYVAWKNGGYTLVYPSDSSYTPSLSWFARTRYCINAFLQRREAGWYLPDLGKNSSRGPDQPRVTRSPSASRVTRRPRTPMRTIARAIAWTGLRIAGLALIGFLAMMGVTRFVHVDAATILRSVHFSIPHFLMPWRPEESAGVPGANAPSENPQPAAAAVPYRAPTQAQFTVQPAESIRTHAERNWLPMPSGPLPFGMPVSGRAATPSIHMQSGPLFASPDYDDDAQDSVTLLGQGSAREATIEPTVAEEQPVSMAAPSPAAVETPENRATPNQGHASAEVRHAAPSRKPEAPARPVVHPGPASAHALAPTRLPANVASQDPSPPPPVQDSHATVDVQLMPVATAGSSVSVHTLGGDSADQAGAGSTSSSGESDVRPKFNVITKTDDSLVVLDHGRMEQIPVGQTLPDGSTLTSVHGQGGGFSTSRGSYVAY
ncbi:hypothetical protein [Paraburkholderia sp. J8-2]|uniref:hypothetical protein n=1 Tax=Paraburkholderia sp. J8-2 TaxID=2805440 RepID=UPI002AB6AE97|nr:hypothetical protein [Paraburkholderia sp. J8-2]